LINYSFPKDDNRKIIAKLDGRDAELFRRIVSCLGSEKKAQDALILEGYYHKLESSGQVSRRDIERMEELWIKIVGMPKSDFEKLVTSNVRKPMN
jgi:hypothetical protein